MVPSESTPQELSNEWSGQFFFFGYIEEGESTAGYTFTPCGI
jgi:hypothetical protein